MARVVVLGAGVSGHTAFVHAIYRPLALFFYALASDKSKHT